MTNKFKSALLEMKKVAFEDAVQRCSKELGLAHPPIVSITDVPCPLSSSSDEIAHIHPEEKIICIWKRKLELIDLDTIEQVAAHEVAHLVSLLHDTKHLQAQIELQTRAWRPPGGTIVIDGSKKISSGVLEKSKKRAHRKNICAYHFCKKRTELSWCPYCEESFCKDHIKPKFPMLPPFEGKPMEMEEWRKSGHPCIAYSIYLKQKEKEDIDKRWEALDRLSGRKHRPKEIYDMSYYTVGRRRKEVNRFAVSVVIILVIIILFVVIWLLKTVF